MLLSTSKQWRLPNRVKRVSVGVAISLTTLYGFYALANWIHFGTGRFHYSYAQWIQIALLMLLPLSELFVVTGYIGKRRRLKEISDGKLLCSCGYDLRGSPCRCPECGATIRDLKSMPSVSASSALSLMVLLAVTCGGLSLSMLASGTICYKIANYYDALGEEIDHAKFSTFDSGAWKEARVDDAESNIRRFMVDDLLASQQLIGMCRDDVRRLLGCPDINVDGDTYILGLEEGFIRVDQQYLHVYYDNEDVVAKMSLQGHNIRSESLTAPGE